MPIQFENNVQLVKHTVLREVARLAFDGKIQNSINDWVMYFNDIAATTVGKKPTMRCCIYKERAIVSERIRLAAGGNRNIKNVIEVIDIACDECPEGGYEVSDNCRGCIAHYCAGACKRDAIHFDEKLRAHIDKSKCVNCGLCAKACHYSAIVNRVRPCTNACKTVKAIGVDEETRAAKIDDEKCVSCGACMMACPFGAIGDKSEIVSIINMLRDCKANNVKACAVIAPAFVSQFGNSKPGQVISAVKKLGFDIVVEAALGADMVAWKESEELKEKGFLTSSCCPAFVDYVKKSFPKLSKNISGNLSPMAEIAKYIRKNEKDAVIVFIGPCTAKKAEIKQEPASKYVDFAMTFSELYAMLDAKGIDIDSEKEIMNDNATYFGRVFARSGGVSEAVEQCIKEHGTENFEFKPCVCSGLDACKAALLKASKGIGTDNFIEGMACQGGCVGGAGNIRHDAKTVSSVNNFAELSKIPTVKEAVGNAKENIK